MALSQLGQIAIAVSNTDAAEAFYGGVLGLRTLYRYGDLCFFDCAGVRLMLSPPENGSGSPRARAPSTSASPTWLLPATSFAPRALRSSRRRIWSRRCRTTICGWPSSRTRTDISSG